MANDQQINIGNSANDGTGDPLRTAFNKYNQHKHPIADLSDAGTAAGLDAGTSNGNLVQLDSLGLPPIDGSQLTGLDASQITGLVESFADLDDVPAYSGNEGKALRINGAGSAVEAVTDQVLDPSGESNGTGLTVQSGAFAFRTPTQMRSDLDVRQQISLAANQSQVRNDANNADEARTQRVFVTWADEISSDSTYMLALWGPIPTILSHVSIRTDGGTCSVQVTKNGSAINGFASAQAASTTTADVTSTETLANGDVLRTVVTSAFSLTGLFVTLNGVRTGD